jgi:hypothetical protein
MVLVREIFQVKFGKMKDALALVKEGERMMTSVGKQHRVLTDLTGPYYTLVFEAAHESLGDFERGLQQESSAGDWRGWYQRFAALIDSGRREIFTIVR